MNEDKECMNNSWNWHRRFWARWHKLYVKYMGKVDKKTKN